MLKLFEVDEPFAEDLARRMHCNQLDKAGAPYFLHLRQVASHFSRGSALWQVAWLHDIVEDTPTDLLDLVKLKFDPEIVEAVEAITKLHGEDRRTYIKRVAANRLALLVKIRDLEHNLQADREPVFFTGEQEKYWEKLEADYEYLMKIKRGHDGQG